MRNSLSTAVLALAKRDILLAYQRLSEILNPILFFVLVACFFPLAISPEPKQLVAIGGGIIWIAALLATLLTLDRLFKLDYIDGSLEQLLLSTHPLSVMVLTKIIVHWLVTGLPLLLVTPLLGIMLGLPAFSIWMLMLSLALGTPVLIFIGAIGSALTIAIHHSGILLTLLIFPLYIPVLIFGTSIVINANQGLPFIGQLTFLAGLLFFAIAIVPIVVAETLKAVVE